MNIYYSQNNKIILKFLTVILCAAFSCAFVRQSFALSSKIVCDTNLFQNSFREFSYPNRNHTSIPPLQQQDIFLKRIASALEANIFDDIFGKKVTYIGIEELSNANKHLLLEPNILNSDVDGISIDMGHVPMSFDDMDAIFQDTRTKVFGFNFWEKYNSEIKKRSKYYLGRVDRVPLSSSWEEDLESKIDYFGRFIIRNMLRDKQNKYIIDFVRKLLFKDEQGNIIPFIYKPFSGVSSEKAAADLINTMGYKHTAPVHVFHDNFGDYAFVEYITQAPEFPGKIRSEKQARMLGKLLPMFYILGLSDITFNNILLSENEDLVPIDMEAIFGKGFSNIKSFEDFEKIYREYRGGLLGGNRVLLMSVEPTGIFHQAYQQGVQESLLQIKKSEKKLKKEVHTFLTNKQAMTRLLLANTGEYGDDLSLRGIVPYYLVPLNSEENKNIEKAAFSRIDELLELEKNYQVIIKPPARKIRDPGLKRNFAVERSI
ncbi:MAG: type 2 lantipeptide synthetase LanM [Candidatus Omnitrophica bacterium]|nr:type 2 lantipeptide synthetase LanM [Candidatus Omnitrophota bacterium]